MDELIYMDYEEACLNALSGPGSQEDVVKSSMKVSSTNGIVDNLVKEEPVNNPTKTNTPIVTDANKKLNYVKRDLSARYAELISKLPKILKRVTGDKESNETHSLEIDGNNTKDVSYNESNNLENKIKHEENQEAETESEAGIKSKSNSEVKIRLFSRIPSFPSGTRIFKKKSEFSNSMRMNNYDVESDTESTDHSRENAKSLPLPTKIVSSVKKLRRDASSVFNKHQNEGTGPTNLEVTEEIEPMKKDNDEQPEEIYVIQQTKAEFNYIISQTSNEDRPFNVASAAKVAQFFSHISNMCVNVTSLFSKSKKISSENNESDNNGAGNIEQPLEDTYELYDDVQTLDADVSPSSCTKKQDQSPNFRKLLKLQKLNFNIPTLQKDKDHLSKISKSFQRQVLSKVEFKPSTSQEVLKTPYATSIQCRENYHKKFPLLVPEKSEPDSNEYEYDEFPSAQRGDNDDDIYEDFVGDPLPMRPTSQDDENLYRNEDAVELANKTVLEEPLLLPPKKNKLSSSDKVDKQISDIQQRQKIPSKLGDFQLPRRSISQEKGGVKGFMKISKKIALMKPISSSNKKGEIKGCHPSIKVKVKHKYQEECYLKIDNRNAYEQRRPINQLLDLQESNEDEYELYEDITTIRQTENNYSEILNLKESPPENVVLRRMFPDVPRPNTKSIIERKGNVQSSTIKPPKPKIISDQRDLPTIFPENNQHNAILDNRHSKEQYLIGNRYYASTERTNQIAEKMTSTEIPPIIPARPKIIPNHIISSLSTSVARDAQNHSIRYSDLEKETPSNEPKTDYAPENDEQSVDIEGELNEKREILTQHGNNSTAEVCENDIYMYMADCYS